MGRQVEGMGGGERGGEVGERDGKDVEVNGMDGRWVRGVGRKGSM